MFDAVVLFLLFGSVSFLSSRADCDELWSLYGLSAVAILAFFLKPRREIQARWLGMFLLVAMFSVFADLRQPVKMTFMNLMFGGFALKAMAERLTISLRGFGRVLFALHGLTLAMILLQLTGLDAVYLPLSGQVSGTFIMPWAMGCFAVLSIPFLYLVSPVACVLVLPSLYFSHSSICIAAAALCFVLMLPKYSRLLLLLSILAVLAYVCFVDPNFDTARFRVLEGSLQYLDSWGYGNSIGSWAHEGFARNNGATLQYWRFAHNELFQVFFETGGLGLTLVLCFLAGLFWKQHVALRSALCGLILLSCFHSIFHYGRLSFFAVMILAMACRETGRALVSPVGPNTTSTQ